MGGRAVAQQSIHRRIKVVQHLVDGAIEGSGELGGRRTLLMLGGRCEGGECAASEARKCQCEGGGVEQRLG